MSRLNPVPRPERDRSRRRPRTERRPLPDARYRRPYGGIFRRTGRGLWGFAVRNAAEGLWAARFGTRGAGPQCTSATLCDFEYITGNKVGDCGPGSYFSPTADIGKTYPNNICGTGVIGYGLQRMGPPHVVFSNGVSSRVKGWEEYPLPVNANPVRHALWWDTWDQRPLPHFPLPHSFPHAPAVPALDPAAQPIHTPVPVPEPVPYEDIPRLPGRRPVRVPRPRVQPGPNPLPGPDPAPGPRPNPQPGPSPVPVPTPGGQPAPGPSPAPNPGTGIAPGTVTFAPGRAPRPQVRFNPRRPPARNEREVKTAISNGFLKLAWWAINAVTESCDAIEAVFNGIPFETRKKLMKVYRPKSGKRAGKRTYAKPSCKDMGRALLNNLDSVDVSEAIKHLINNQIEDAVYGRIGKLGGQGARNAGHLANFSYQTDKALRQSIWNDLIEAGVVDPISLDVLETK